MIISARTLRRVLLATALLLVAVIVGFLGYARYRAHQYLAALPRRLGVDIKQETNGFTYSQSVGGHTVFTVHASKEVQRTNGRVTLHDVGITLYGRTPGSADRIHGSDFEYDPASGVLTAQGEVYLDLEAPAGDPSAEAGSRTNTRTIHVKTSGLVFVEKQRTANTDQPIEFSAGGFSGYAVGASYDSSAGTLILKRDVAMKALRAGRPLALTASHAEIDRNANLVRLASASLSEAVGNGTEKLQAQHAEIAISASGAPAAVNAQGTVIFTQADGATLSGDRLRAEFDSNSNGATLRRAHFSGSLRFGQVAPGQTRQGQAEALEVAFNSAGKPVRADLTGGVVADEHTASIRRSLRAAKLQLVFQAGDGGLTFLRDAEAFGDGANSAHIAMVGPQPKPGAQVSTDISAAHLSGRFAAANRGVSLQSVEGNGETQIKQAVVNEFGAKTSEEESVGDFLRATFKLGPSGRAVLERAEQHGHVSAVRQLAATGVKGHVAPEQTQHARAQNAQFDATTNRILLTGAVAIENATGQLFADQVSIDRASRTADANGSVRATYSPSGKTSDPVHLIADRAESDQATGVTRFFGGSTPNEKGKPAARLWQGGSQIQAAEIDFDRPKRKVTAYGREGEVRAVLANLNGKSGSGLTRVSSMQLVYSDTSHEIVLTGAVKVVGQQGSLACRNAKIQLAPTSKLVTTVAGAGTLMSGKVERIEADGGVTLAQLSRRANGEKLVYTATDETYVLTGTKSIPPRLTDAARGTITGAALRFHAGDDSVEILGSAGQRVQGQAQLSKSTKGRK